METLLETLYTYAQEERMMAALDRGGGGYRRLSGLAEGDLEALEALLEDESARLLSRYLDHRAEADLLHDMALFRCGLSMGLELGALAQGM